MEQSTTLQHVLNKGKTLLDNGDVQGYWTLMSEHSGYAKLAGEVASGKGVFAHIAKTRLQRAAKKNLGRKLSDSELSEIRMKIAKADHGFRSQNLKTEGHIGVSGDDTVQYHKRVFKEIKLPADTYTPAHLQNIAGSFWSKATGTPTHDVKDKDIIDATAEMKRRFDADPKGFMDELGPTGVDFLTTGMDAVEFVGDDKTLTSPFGVGHDPLEKTVGPKDGEAKPQNQDISTGTDAGDDDLENASPENRKFMDDLLKPGNPVDEIMLKKPQDLTQGEFVELKKAMIDLPAGPEQERLDKTSTAFLEHRFGTIPVRYDAVGRMIDPKPVNAIPEAPKPLASADRKPLKYALRRIGRGILKAAKDDGLAAAVKHLQGGINILADTAKKGTPIVPQLKQDGVFGAKTRSGLKGAVTALGTPKVEEGLALGRFNQFARDGRKDGFRGLAEETEKSFAPLFRGPTKRPADRIEAMTLQETLNDLGGAQFGHDTFTPLKLDGDIGVKNTGAFRQIAATVGPEPLTKRYGHFLGFF